MANNYSNFFDPIRDTLVGKHQFKVSRPTRAGDGYLFATCHDRDVKYEIRLARGKLARVALHFDSKDQDKNIKMVQALCQRRGEIEDKIGRSLDWNQTRDTKRRRIEITRPGNIDDDDNTLAEIKDWMIQNLLRFRQAFDPHLNELAGQ